MSRYIPVSRVEGQASRQAHCDLPDGTFEREVSKEGFFGPASFFYHRHPPTAWVECVEVPRGVIGQDIPGRLWDVLWMARSAVARTRGRGRSCSSSSTSGRTTGSGYRRW